MIQYYINSRPVPKAIARHHLAQARPHAPIDLIDLMLKHAKTDKQAAADCAAYGVSVANIWKVQNENF